MPPFVHGPVSTTVASGNEQSGEKTAPVLVFSSDTVLDRQSMNAEGGFSALDVNDLHNEVAGVFDASPTTIESSSISTITSSEFSSPPVVQKHHQLGFRSGVKRKLLPRMSSSLDFTMRQTLFGHILICGPFDHGSQLACYLNELYTQETSPVHAESSDARPKIVLLVKTLPSAEEIAASSRSLPPNVFIESGMSENVEDLLRVRAYEARCVLLLPGVSNKDSVDVASDDLCSHLEDYQVIMSTLALRTMDDLHREHLQQQPPEVRFDRGSLNVDGTSGCSVVRSHNSIKFFAYKSHGGIRAPEDTQSSRDDDEDSIAGVSDVPRNEYQNERIHDHRRRWKNSLKRLHRPSSVQVDYLSSPCFTPTYAAGEVFVDCVLDTLLCQSFFNPYVVDLVRALAGDYHSDASRYSSPQATFKASMMRYFTPATASPTASASADVTSPPQQGGASNSCPVLRVATISRELEGAPFAEVFSKALSQHMLVLSVYRRAQAGGRGNALPYVVTCPDSPFSCVVERGDQLHVLTKRPAPVSIR
ncbi:hypothetical protein ON010_g15697 [Phytophthora cinnamomi]|nr:hypothetical protein ON010_g15697 [Phytophthora cinnamomi]